jgi:hypothetical protein
MRCWKVVLFYRRKLENIEACTVKSYGILRVKNGLIFSMYFVTKYTVYNVIVHKIHSVFTNDDLYLLSSNSGLIVKIAFYFYTG